MGLRSKAKRKFARQMRRSHAPLQLPWPKLWPISQLISRQPNVCLKTALDLHPQFPPAQGHKGACLLSTPRRLSTLSRRTAPAPSCPPSQARRDQVPTTAAVSNFRRNRSAQQHGRLGSWENLACLHEVRRSRRELEPLEDRDADHLPLAGSPPTGAGPRDVRSRACPPRS
jgi:hypothetical protein